MGYAEKYNDLLEEGLIKYIVIYNDPNFKPRKGIISWEDFMKEGEGVDKLQVEERMNKIKPGNCATLVYTSGTTGMPKGVMISHDNCIWTYQAAKAYHQGS